MFYWHPWAAKLPKSEVSPGYDSVCVLEAVLGLQGFSLRREEHGILSEPS